MIDASPVTLAAVWDRAAETRGARRIRTLLALESSDRGAEGWTLGTCDAMLARIYRGLFGDLVEATVRCSTCDELLEIETTVGELFGSAEAVAQGSGSARVHQDPYDVALRPLQLGDLFALPSSPADARSYLLRCAVLEARCEGRAIDVEKLPESVCDAIDDAVRASDPLAEIIITLSCPACAHRNDVPFDIGTFLWEALDRCIAQTFAEVHALASAYGWSERDILALPERRRHRYLELLAL